MPPKQSQKTNSAGKRPVAEENDGSRTKKRFRNYHNDDVRQIVVAKAERDKYRQTFDLAVQSVFNRSPWTFHYNPLPEGYIRLLNLHKGVPDEPLKITLGMDRLDEDLTYDALSYYWGDSFAVNPVLIDDITLELKDLSPKQKFRQIIHKWRKVLPRLFVRNNLDVALRRLRRVDKDIVLWVDAICINQSDPVEKSKQLLRMPDIYRKAQKVRIWLGEANQFTDTGMSFISELLQDEQNEDLYSVKEDKQKVFAFIDLIRSTWFGRRWSVL